MKIILLIMALCMLAAKVELTPTEDAQCDADGGCFLTTGKQVSAMLLEAYERGRADAEREAKALARTLDRYSCQRGDMT